MANNRSRFSYSLFILILILIVPSIIYFYVTKGSNNFIHLEIIGEQHHNINAFSFVNQDNEVVTNDSLEGNIYVANFFFTSCPTICPIMTKNMAYLQSELSQYDNIRFLSHTVDPINDTPEKLRYYIEKEMKAKNVTIDLSNWDFLTGEKTELYDIARLYLLASPNADELAPGGFIHSEYFVLIDKEGRIRSGIDRNKNIRGAYDGTNDIHMKDLINDIKVLMAEYKKPRK
jgi:protein SCO1/2